MESERKNNIKKELDHFMIGDSYGGNQRWMRDPWMHIGGCAALTTCDAFIYMMLYQGRKQLYPFSRSVCITKKQYRKFAMMMKPYLQPRETGIKDIDTYIEGVRIYLEDSDVSDIELAGVEGSEEYERAAERIVASIDDEMPVPYLMLKNQHKEMKFFEWHWFLLNGYELREGELYVKAATYGKAHWINFRNLWDTGHDEKGGFVLFSEKAGDQTRRL